MKFFALLIMLFASMAWATDIVPFQSGDLEHVLTQAKRENKRVLVLAYVEGCPRAERVAKIFREAQELNMASAQYVLLGMDMNIETPTGGLRGSPTLVVLDPGKVGFFSSGEVAILEGERHDIEVFKNFLNDPETYARD